MNEHRGEAGIVQDQLAVVDDSLRYATGGSGLAADAAELTWVRMAEGEHLAPGARRDLADAVVISAVERAKAGVITPREAEYLVWGGLRDAGVLVVPEP